MSEEHTHGKITRKRLLRQAGLAAAAVGVGGGLAACGTTGEPAGQVPQDTMASQFKPLPPAHDHSVLGFFTKDEAITLDAVVARLIPGDATDPGAREAGVPQFIDGKLTEFPGFATPTYFDPPFAKPVALPPGPQNHANGVIRVEATELPRYGFQGKDTPQKAYRKGLAALDRYTRHKHGVRFAKLHPAKQDEILAVLEAGKAAGWPQAKGFFKMVLEDTYEGMFSDPIYGGNRDYAGWKLVGYPGAQRAYTPYEIQHGPQEKHVQGLRDMPAMNPGVPQGNVILPLAGTRPPTKG